MIRFILILFLCVLNSSINAQASIESILDAYKKDKDLTHAQYGFCIMEASTGKVLKEYNSEMALIPASTMKIVTTSAALGLLGKDFTYKTNYFIIHNGTSLEQATLSNLFVEGSGDPSFNSSYFYSNDSLFFNPFINKLKTKKIKELISNIQIDNTKFNNTIPSTWIWGDIGNYFGAGANGLSYKDNKFSIYYESGDANTIAKILSIKPNYFATKMKLTSNVLSYGSEDEAYVYGDPDLYTRKISGTIPPNKTNYEVEAQMPEPAEFFKYELLYQLKKNQLIAFNDSTKLNPNDKTLRKELIYTHTSPRLEKLIFYTNTKSNNHYAESLLNTIESVKSGKQGTTQNGIDAVTNYWQSRGVDVTGLHMADGSGLSRANTITTKVQASILSKIYKDSTMYTAFNNSLPIAGKNGSMTSLCKGTFAENNMRAKTGYINRARGYCGYVKTKSGKELAFSVLFNNYNCSPKEMKLKIEKLLVALVDL